jgi:DNA-binding response OmpR family regulator
MAHILIVEDDAAIADLVAIYLRKDGHEVEIIRNGATALAAIDSASIKPDLIVLDLMLPGLDGRGVARRLRARAGIPIVMLTALDDDRDKIEGFELGADDYITKPFNPDELTARIRAVLRRTSTPHSPGEPESTNRTIGAVTIDAETRRVFAHDAELTLRTKEFDLLSALAEHPGVVLSRNQLLERVWGGDFSGDTRTVDVHISRLRERLDSAKSGIVIESVRSIGYRLIVQK